MEQTSNKIKPFDIKRSLEKGKKNRSIYDDTVLVEDLMELDHSKRMERIRIIRRGIPYTTVEVIGRKLNKSQNWMIHLINTSRTTYNRKIKEKALLDSHQTELLLSIDELLGYGIEVFNNEEEKFYRWLTKPNHFLGGFSPDSMLDTITGINEVMNCLNRIEYGNFS